MTVSCPSSYSSSFVSLKTFFDLCEGGRAYVELQILESGRARDVHASTVGP